MIKSITIKKRSDLRLPREIIGSGQFNRNGDIE
jgi:hypothetical protein